MDKTATKDRESDTLKKPEHPVGLLGILNPCKYCKKETSLSGSADGTYVQVSCGGRLDNGDYHHTSFAHNNREFVVDAWNNFNRSVE